MKNNKLNKTIETIKNVFNVSKRNKIIIGISGGIDSLVALKIFMTILPKENIYAYYLPIQNNNSEVDVNLISNHLNISIQKNDLTNLWTENIRTFNINDDNNKLNLKTKIRSLFLSSKAFEYNALLVSCLNYDEYYLGYFTKNGDSIGDIYPLINFCKKEIYELANEWNLPKEIINKKPSADLYEGQSDELDLKLTYDDIDKYLLNLEVSQEVENRMISLKNINSHKHNLEKYIFNDNGLRKI